MNHASTRLYSHKLCQNFSWLLQRVLPVKGYEAGGGGLYFWPHLDWASSQTITCNTRCAHLNPLTPAPGFSKSWRQGGQGVMKNEACCTRARMAH